MRRIRRTLFALLASVGLVLAVQAPAMAVDDWGTTWGFTYFPLTTQNHCGSGTAFEFSGYRSGASQMTLEWDVHAHGTMAIRAWNNLGPVSGIHYYDSQELTGTRVYYVHWPTSVHGLDYHFTFSPLSGGSCYDYAMFD